MAKREYIISMYGRNEQHTLATRYLLFLHYFPY